MTVALALLLTLAAALGAQSQPRTPRPDAQRIDVLQPLVVALWPDGTPGAPGGELPKERVSDRPAGGDRHVRDVHRPSITVYRPADSAATPRPAVVVCPGGGYGVLALDKEGHDIARWLAEHGTVGVVLKYRLPRPRGHVYGHAAPLADAQRSIELVRQHATKWRIDPRRVGIMGFSAGGHLAASASVAKDGPTPDFTVLIYPVVSLLPPFGHAGSRRNLLGKEAPESLAREFSSELQVTKNTPPAFLVHTSDDPVRVENSLLYYQALRKAGVRAELHVFERGGHGYGMRKPKLPVGRWPQLLLAWLAER